MSYRLQDGSQCFDLNSNIKQMGSKEEIVEVAQNGEGKVPQAVQECLKFAQKSNTSVDGYFISFSYVICDGDTRFPNLVAPINVQNPTIRNNYINFFLINLLINFTC